MVEVYVVHLDHYLGWIVLFQDVDVLWYGNPPLTVFGQQPEVTEARMGYYDVSRRWLGLGWNDMHPILPILVRTNMSEAATRVGSAISLYSLLRLLLVQVSILMASTMTRHPRFFFSQLLIANGGYCGARAESPSGLDHPCEE
jgi:hypothetical protein